MGFSFLNPFKKKLKAISIDYTLLESYAENNELLFFHDQHMFLREENMSIPALIFDPYRGFYLFEHKDWNYSQLKNSKVQPAQKHSHRPASINIDGPYDFMRQKFNEILHHDGCNIAKFVYMDALSSTEFNQLDDSFASLMPAENIIFYDDDHESIMRKLHDALEKQEHALPTQELLSALFVHHHFLADTLHPKCVRLNPEQLDFVEREYHSKLLVRGVSGSGKSSSFLLKAIYEKLLNPDMRITYITPTLLSAELLKQRLLDIIEHHIIDIDLTTLSIITPQQLIQSHFRMLNKKAPLSKATITPKMRQKKFDVADLVFCDDIHLLESDFTSYLEHICANTTLIVSSDYVGFQDYPEVTFTQHYRCQNEVVTLAANLLHDETEAVKNHAITSHCNNTFVDTLLLVNKLLKECVPEEILIIATNETLTRGLEEELTLYIGRSNTRVNDFEGLLYQDINKLLITDINNMSGLQRNHVIIAGIDDQTAPHTLAYAMGRSGEKLYLVFEGDSTLKTFFETKEIPCQK